MFSFFDGFLVRASYASLRFTQICYEILCAGVLRLTLLMVIEGPSFREFKVLEGAVHKSRRCHLCATGLTRQVDESQMQRQGLYNTIGSGLSPVVTLRRRERAQGAIRPDALRLVHDVRALHPIINEGTLMIGWVGPALLGILITAFGWAARAFSPRD